eukprot:CAMPEP_0197701578 /NCGR_PEP_ID=MMETSP1338-20131121/123423_1 /TAXON_ID=43686 ORGANISM="Pelagodinium beii, Strain RCC1491" /NCGR_SAMPLE_ID=MMETSP1338 /ASSEMBLY_ACC=CAM_ASM_000754 /LENGTH=76 /DNA_ID=CAMNT_0043285291 /DNA_START=42 /DNA_END=268 /DNA_ORIENTATION=+
MTEVKAQTNEAMTRPMSLASVQTKLDDVSRGLLRICKDIETDNHSGEDVNIRLLLHGTKVAFLRSLLASGLDEKFS